MSGIVGIWNRDGTPVDRDLLQSMTAFQKFRGPHRQTTWMDGSLGFGHSLFHIDPATQPFLQQVGGTNGNWITADARIDARAELLVELWGVGCRVLENASDAELILHAYERWGERCLEHLLGDFSFAIWDQERQRLFAAVDHFGIKQFFYTPHRPAFVFSNTLHCLRLHPDVSDRLNETAVGDFLLFDFYQDPDATIFADIRKIPPGHCLIVEREHERVASYWSGFGEEELHLPTPQDYLQRFQELLQKAVADRTRGARVAISLSGGVDSPVVALAARREQHRRGFDLRAHTYVFDWLVPDQEKYYAGKVAASLQIPIDYHSLDDFELFDWVHLLERSPGEPLNNPYYRPFAEFSAKAAADCPILLTGLFGDVLTQASLRNHWFDQLKRGHLARLVGDMTWYVATQHKFPPVGLRTLLKKWYRERPALPHWLNPDFARRTNLRQRWAHYVNPQPQVSARGLARSWLRSTDCYFNLYQYDAGFTGLNQEVCHPLLDLRVARFLLSLPPLPWCLDKAIFRRYLQAEMPRDICTRPKAPLRQEPVQTKLAASYSPGQTWGTFLEGSGVTPQLHQFVEEATFGQTALRTDRQHLWDIWTNFRPVSLNSWLITALNKKGPNHARKISPAPPSRQWEQDPGQPILC